jgi:Ca2+-binding RTX toxin-like protein
LVMTNHGGRLEFLSDDHVVIGGTDRTDRIQSGAGDDTLWGDGGNDVLDGALGNDAVIGGDGNDRLTGGDGDDFVNGAAGNDKVWGGAGSDLLVGLEGRDRIEAGDGDDEVFGGLGNDQIFGGAGNDELLGNEGNDWMKGGQGDDHLTGDNGNPFGEPLPDTDTALFSGKAKNYTITHNADGSITVTDNVGAEGTDTLQNIERLRFADKMVLADGSAEATGGDGGDTFVFNLDYLKGKHNTATITDFDSKVDKLQLLNDVYVKVSSDHHGETLLQVGNDTIDLLDVKPNGLHHRDWA